jgi:serine/threonine protein kinase
VSSENVENISAKGDVSLFTSTVAVGQKIADRWQLVELLGEGNLSTVFKAEEQTTRKVVAIKEIHHHLVQAVNNLSRFEQKARTFIALNHEHISNFYDIHVDPNNDVFLFCDYFESENLEEVLSKTGHISVERATKIFKQAADGLEYAHRQKILHRDLKPSNVCIVNDQYSVDDVRIVDFGIARLLVEESQDTKSAQFVSHTRDVFGSALYMSPEQCMGKKVDSRSDIYALGCIMHECINGKPPFVGRNVMETAYKHMNEAPLPLVGPTPPTRAFERYQLIVSKALQKSPDRRYQTMAELRHDFDIMLDANDNKWQAAAFCLKGSSRTAFQTIAGQRLPWGAITSVTGILLLLSVIGFWAFNLLSDDVSVQDYPRYDTARMWVVQDKKPRGSVEDFSTKRENARMELEKIEQDHTKNSREYAGALGSLCRLFMDASRWADAAMELKQLGDIEQKVPGKFNTTHTYSDLALCYFMQNENDLAETNALKAIELNSHPDSPETVHAKDQALNILGDIYTQKGDNKRAMDVYLKLFGLGKDLEIKQPSGYSKNAARLADAYRRMHDFKDAQRYYLTAMDKYRNFVSHSSEFMAKCKFGYALAYADQKDYKNSQIQLKDALPIATTYAGPRSGLVGAIRKQYLENLYHSDFWGWVKVKMKPDDDPMLKAPEEAPAPTENQQPL